MNRNFYPPTLQAQLDLVREGVDKVDALLRSFPSLSTGVLMLDGGWRILTHDKAAAFAAFGETGWSVENGNTPHSLNWKKLVNDVEITILDADRL